MKQVNSKLYLHIFAFGLLVIPVILGYHFRTFELRPPDFLQKHYVRELATEHTLGLVARQIAVARGELPGKAWKASKKDIGLAKEQVKSDKSKFKEVRDGIATQLLAKRYENSSRLYLKGADSYYFLDRTRQLLRYNEPGSEHPRASWYLNKKRVFPEGAPEKMQGHPYVGKFWFQLGQAVGLTLDLMTALTYLPLVFFVFSAIVFHFLLIYISKSRIAAFAGSLCFSLAPIFISRSSLGWYDTDIYHVLFFLIELFLVEHFLADSKYRRWRSLLILATVAVVHSFFWQGWVIPLGGAVTGLLFAGVLRRRENPNQRLTLLLCGVMSFVTAWLIYMAIFGMQDLIDSMRVGTKTLASLSAVSWQAWPNALFLVGESAGRDLKTILSLSGSWSAISLAIVSMILIIGVTISGKQVRGLSAASTALIFLVMSLKSERFSLFLFIPISLLAGLSIPTLISFMSRIVKTDRFRQGTLIGGGWLKTSLSLTLVLVLALPGILRANQAAVPWHSVMNDTWSHSLETLRDNSGSEDIVYSWFDPGYFINAVADRKTSVDGGSQERPRIFWIARAFMAQDENLSAAIFRMLSLGGEKATEICQLAGMKSFELVPFLERLLVMKRHDALLKLPEKWGTEQKENFLDMTHGREKLGYSQFVFIYDDLIRNNLALSIIANWDFRKAEDEASTNKKSKANIFKNNIDRYLTSSGKIWKYLPETFAVGQDETNIYFRNYIQVNMKEKYAVLQNPTTKEARRLNLIMLEDNVLTEYSANNGEDEHVLIFKKNAQWYNVVASRNLIHSTLFRLYYLNAAGLNRFQLIGNDQDPAGPTQLKSFKIVGDIQ